MSDDSAPRPDTRSRLAAATSCARRCGERGGGAVRAALLLLAALGCGRVGFDPVGGLPFDDANPAVVFAGSCTSPAQFPVNAAAVAQLAPIADGVVYGGDFGDLETFRFDNGDLVQLATRPIPSVDGLATDPAGERIIALTALAGTKYTIVDRMLAGPPVTPLADMSVPGTFGIVSTPTGFAVAGINQAGNAELALTDRTGTTPLASSLAVLIPSLAAVPGGMLSVTPTANTCDWRWLDNAGALAGSAIDDPIRCGDTGIWPDASGARVLFTWQPQSSSTLNGRIRELSTGAWLTGVLQLSPAIAGMYHVMAMPAGWYVVRVEGSQATVASVVSVSPAGTISTPWLMVPGAFLVVRLFTVAGRAYLGWINADSNSDRTLRIQQLCP
jgi:hypothetical protein